MSQDADCGVAVTFEMELKEQAVEPMIKGFAAALEETRAFPGCRSVNAYRSHEDPNRIILLENWDSVEAYQKYIAWRTETGSMDGMVTALAKPSRPQFWSMVA
ncbi:putative quinol monooxygenase [Rhizorhapis sp. SPR117]|uniref:putative quinol monooxygenase n=1 Tax=Rhizorhapis sp. SPR117 TaxID=2912611 RepID=UPI001F24B5FD|nr:antibiotic biosynthesis monooxygenase [Rhizorhapis sp. SPR117]